MSLLVGLLSVSFAQTSTWYQSALESQSVQGARAQNTVVAVIDTGIDTRHPALKSALWTNPGESGLDSKNRDKATNGVDDDKNGFIDDVHGWNFARGNSHIQDEHGHGTHISGLIAADAPGFRGVAPGTKIMTLKYFDPQAPIGGNLMNSVRAIKYALAMGAHIINYSGGGLDPHPGEKKALEEAQRKGVLVIAAAGNENTDADQMGFYPASYGLSNILSVMAYGPDRKRLPASNWGPQTVQISAPGEQILSTYLEGQLAYMSGTSQATALVTGVAVLLREKKEDLKNPQDLIKFLIASGSFNKNLVGKIANPQGVSIKRALQMEDRFSEEIPEGLAYSKRKTKKSL